MSEVIELFKQAAAPKGEMAMYGRLSFSRSGYLIMSVPNALGRGVFDTLQEPGIELPVSGTTGQYNAHVSVMTPKEVELCGGPDEINERGHSFPYTLGELYSVEPEDWPEVKKVWCIRVISHALQALRKSYGLPALKQAPSGESMPFHITVAIRKTGVLGHNEEKYKENTWGSKPVEESKSPHDIADGESKQVKLADTLLKQFNREGKKVNTEPTDAQREAGNYQKGHVRMHGLDISIENPAGSLRSGVDKQGNKWSIKMKNHYGYIRGTRDRDGDHVDCFVGDEPDTELVFVVDQINPDSGRFDEHKVVFGVKTEAAAKELYLSNYKKDWKGFGGVVGLTVKQFKAWLEDGDTQSAIGDHVFEMKTAGVLGIILKNRGALRVVTP